MQKLGYMQKKLMKIFSYDTHREGSTFIDLDFIMAVGEFHKSMETQIRNCLQSLVRRGYLKTTIKNGVTMYVIGDTREEQTQTN